MSESPEGVADSRISIVKRTVISLTCNTSNSPALTHSPLFHFFPFPTRNHSAAYRLPNSRYEAASKWILSLDMVNPLARAQPA
jgi:hypothetical protein